MSKLKVTKKITKVISLVMVFSMLFSVASICSAAQIHPNNATYQTTLFVYGSRDYRNTSFRLFDGSRIGIDFTASVSGYQNGNNVLELIDSNGN